MPRRLKIVFWALLGCALSGLASGCARYALLTNEGGAPPPRQVSVRINEPLEEVRDRLELYLRNRGRIEQARRVPGRDGFVYFLQPWVRDSSLRYHYLYFDERHRHLSEWKALWSLRAAGPRQTDLQLKVLEVIYAGLSGGAPDRPDVPTRQGGTYSADWFETEPDGLRAQFELRRFWIESYPTKALPRIIASLEAPSLDAIPSSLSSARQRQWRALSRARSF